MIRSKNLRKFKQLEHGFFNSIGGVSKGIYKSLNCGPGSFDKSNLISANLKIVLRKLKSTQKKLVLLHQVHSDKIFFINKKYKKKLIGDGLLTKNKNLAIGILTADCCPILFYDPKKNIIGPLSTSHWLNHAYVSPHTRYFMLSNFFQLFRRIVAKAFN